MRMCLVICYAIHLMRQEIFDFNFRYVFDAFNDAVICSNVFDWHLQCELFLMSMAG